MKLKEYLESFYEDTAKTSDLVLNLSYAGFGIIWLFKENIISTQNTPQSVLYSILGFALTILFHFLQLFFRAYLVGGFFNEKFNEGIGLDEEVENGYDDWRRNIVTTLYWIKSILLIISYILLGYNLYTTFSSQ
jgi:hypothetical protein